MNLGAMSHDVFMEQIRRFGREVLPKLQAHQVKRVPAAEMRGGVRPSAGRHCRLEFALPPRRTVARRGNSSSRPTTQPTVSPHVPNRHRPPASNEPEHSTAYYFLEGLNELGIEYLFCNFGTDHAPIIEAMADRKKRGEKMPTVMLCPHENTAAHMARGYAAVTGRGQAVLVHVDVGTANTANAMHNLFRTRLPVLLMAGKAPYTTNNELVGSRDTYVHFVQEPIDQGALVRPYMKWEWTLPSGVVVKEALRRAHTIMQTKPPGPVYFMVQRETLTERWASDQIRSYSATSSRSRSRAAPIPR